MIFWNKNVDQKLNTIYVPLRKEYSFIHQTDSVINKAGQVYIGVNAGRDFFEYGIDGTLLNSFVNPESAELYITMSYTAQREYIVAAGGWK
jgi:hypothetical protein